MIRAITAALGFSLLTGCSSPRLYMRVSGDTGKCIVSFRYRGIWRTKDGVVIHRVDVYREPSNDNSVAICELRSPDGDKALSEWQYGTGPAGFLVSRCANLLRGERYSIDASGGGAGVRLFGIRPDGTVDDLGHEWE